MAKLVSRRKTTQGQGVFPPIPIKTYLRIRYGIVPIFLIVWAVMVLFHYSSKQANLIFGLGIFVYWTFRLYYPPPRRSQKGKAEVVKFNSRTAKIDLCGMALVICGIFIAIQGAGPGPDYLVWIGATIIGIGSLGTIILMIYLGVKDEKNIKGN